MQKSRVILLVALVAAAGALAYTMYRRSTASPFTFGTMRAGRSFAEVDGELRDVSHIELRCEAITSGYRICRGPMEDPAGDVTLVVSQKGRIVVVDRRVSELSDSTKQLTSDAVAKWNEESAGVAVGRAGVPASTRWVSDDNRWSAVMVPKRGSTSAAEVVLTDEHTLATLDEKTLPVLLVLSRERLVPPGALDAAERRSPGALARAADKLAAAGRPLADAAKKLPECGPQASLGIDPGMARRAALGPAASEILTQAVAQLFPDRRLELRDSVYLVDASGVSELIEVTDPVPVRKGTAWAFAVNYAGRIAAIARSTQAFDAPSCVAHAEVIVATLDRSRTKVVKVERFLADDEGFANRVVDMRMAGDASAPRLLVHSLATYGSGDWYGEVDWIGTMSVDSLRVGDWRPTTLAKMDTRSRVAAMDLAPLSAPDAPTAGVLAGKRVDAVVQSNDGSSAQPVFLPAGIAGRPSGWSMLTIL